MQKPAREQGLNTQLEGYALANARAATPGDTPPGTQAPSPASVPKDVDGLSKDSSSLMSSSITPEEPPLQAGAPAFPAYRIIGEPEDLDFLKRRTIFAMYGFMGGLGD